MTALREVLAPLRPDAAAVTALRLVAGADEDAAPHFGRLSVRELDDRVLSSGRLNAARPPLDLIDHAVRAEVARVHAAVLAAFSVPHLDETDVRSRDRKFTQALARTLWDAGEAAVRYASNVDGLPCVALFEGRGHVEPAGEPRPLAEIKPMLEQACDELGLSLVA